MNISFSGTREGMSRLQQKQLQAWLEENKDKVLSAAHGLCIGADVQFHKAVRGVCGGGVRILGFPSTFEWMRTTEVLDCDFLAAPKYPTDRNKDIVLAGPDLLLAAPLSVSRGLYAGTWNAVRYAEKVMVPVKILGRKEQ